MRLHSDMTESLSTHPAFIAGTWTLDPAHSELGFSVRHLAISTVKGSFEKFDGTITTAEDGTASVTVTIDVASVTTNQADRDGHLRTGDFFKVDEFPTATFSSTSVSVIGEDVTVEGELTLRGVTKPVTLTGEFGGVTTDPYGNTKAGASVSTKIDRTEFGIAFNAPLEAGGVLLGNDVTITAELQFALQK